MLVLLAQKLQPLWHHVRHAARLEQLVVQPVPVRQDIIHLQDLPAPLQPIAPLVPVKLAVLSIPPLLAVPKVPFLINYNVLLPLLDIILIVLK